MGEADKFVPDAICGDLDSIEEETHSDYQRRGVRMIHLQDQDRTDFTKTLEHVVKEMQSEVTEATNEIFTVTDFTGRLDHALSNLHTLYQADPSVSTYLVNSETLTFLLQPGLNVIYLDNDVCGKYCGVFSLGMPACVTTSGFKYDMSERTLAFESFVSACNQFEYSAEKTLAHASVDWKRRHCCVQTDRPLIFTMSLNIPKTQA